MKNFIQLLTNFFLTLILFSLQLCLLKYEHTININLLLIAYTYSFFSKSNTIISAFLIVLLDGINFIMTGYFGFTLISLTVFSGICLKLEGNFYNKLVLPISTITLYSLAQSLIFLYSFNNTDFFINFIISGCINSTILILIWLLTKQPVHD